MLSTEEFKVWADKVVLFLHNTSRCDDEPYPNLLREKGGNGFPTMSYLATTGTLLKQLDFPTTLETMEAGYQQLQDWKKLRAAVEGGATDKSKQLFLMELDMGVLPFAQATQAFRKLEFSSDESAAIEQELVNLQFVEILRATPRDKMHEGGAKYLEMYRAGRIPTAAQDTSFWQYMFAHAGATKNVALYEELLVAIKETKKDDRRLQRYLPRLEKQLEALKKSLGG